MDSALITRSASNSSCSRRPSSSANLFVMPAMREQSSTVLTPHTAWHSPGVGERVDILAEGVQCLAGLLHHERFSFEGTYFQLRDASLGVRPVQARVPVCVGGMGEKRIVPRRPDSIRGRDRRRRWSASPPCCASKAGCRPSTGSGEASGMTASVLPDDAKRHVGRHDSADSSGNVYGALYFASE